MGKKHIKENKMVSKGRGRKERFSVVESLKLIEVWGSAKIQAKFNSNKRHGLIWEQISNHMIELQVMKTPQECKNRINHLKSEYFKRKPKSG